ncbi:MAG: hypothetical protein BA873_12040 [Desulfobulbaceae bacterium C00003063]|nr:MAG: hypothetical protein BA873_12040 [Desulfobulbaceae bacterium C00003063]
MSASRWDKESASEYWKANSQALWTESYSGPGTDRGVGEKQLLERIGKTIGCFILTFLPF